MERIQRKFRCRQVNKWICKVHFTKDITTNKTFEQFTKLIMHKSTLSLINLILTKLTRIANYGSEKPLTSQVFLSAFVIYGYENGVIDQPTGIIGTKNKINDTVVKISKELVEYYDSLHDNVTVNKVKIFYKILKTYHTIFNTWKTNDLNNLIPNLTVTYYELQTTINKIQDKNDLVDDDIEFRNLCKEHQANILDKIVYLNGQEYFNNYQNQEIHLDENLQMHIKEIIYNAFWDILKDELESDPPKYGQLIRILEDLRDLFCEFVPNRPDIQEEIRSKIDPEFIKNMVEHGVFDNNNLYNLAVYIISLVKQFQSPSMDEDVKLWEETMLNQFNQDFEHSTFLVIYFRSIFNMIHSIILKLNI